MEIEVSTHELSRALHVVTRVQRRKSLGADGGITLEVGEGGLRVAAMNATALSTTMSMRVAGASNAEGETFVHGRTLRRMVNELRGSRTMLSGDHYGLIVESGGFTGGIAAVRDENMRNERALAPDAPGVSIAFEHFDACLALVIPPVSRDKGRPNLGGAHVSVADGRISFVSTDGKRLSFARAPVEGEPPVAFRDGGVLLSRHALKCIRRAYYGGDVVELGFRDAGNQITARTSRWEMSVQAIAGTFPTWRNVMPTGEPDVRMLLGRDELVAALRRVGTSRDRFPSPLIVRVEGGQMKLSVTHSRQGTFAEETLGVYPSSDAELTVAFAHRYVLDAVESLCTPTVRLDLFRQDEKMPPAVFSEFDAEGGVELWGVVMPMKL